MSRSDSEVAWAALLQAVTGLGEVEETSQGFILRFVDPAGRPHLLTVLVSPEEWLDYVGDWCDEDAALERAIAELRASDPRAKALMVREYGLLFAPYVPRL